MTSFDALPRELRCLVFGWRRQLMADAALRALVALPYTSTRHARLAARVKPYASARGLCDAARYERTHASLVLFYQWS